MRVIIDDGGRATAGFKGYAGDCVVRSIAIASKRSYQEIYNMIQAAGHVERSSKHARKAGKSSPRTGVHTTRIWFKSMMADLGFTWTPTMHIGSGCKVHLVAGEIPMQGRLVVCLSKHYTAVIDSVLHDAFDPSRAGTRCVYGYWTFNEA